jgi:hypothetical protein
MPAESESSTALMVAEIYRLILSWSAEDETPSASSSND